MKRSVILILAALAVCSAAHNANAVTCAAGVYRAGCTGPNGTAAVRRPAAPYRPVAPVYHAAPVYRSGGAVKCAAGAYHAGCVGPNGAVVGH